MSFEIVELDRKLIEYCGKKILVEMEAAFIAVDRNGMIYTFKTQPDLDLQFDYWTEGASELDTCEHIGCCEYKGDWRDSLMILED